MTAKVRAKVQAIFLAPVKVRGIIIRQSRGYCFARTQGFNELYQRQLQIGYNKAANLVERMEREGLIGQATATGKREIFGRDPTRNSRKKRTTKPRM